MSQSAQSCAISPGNFESGNFLKSTQVCLVRTRKHNVRGSSHNNLTVLGVARFRTRNRNNFLFSGLDFPIEQSASVAATDAIRGCMLPRTDRFSGLPVVGGALKSFRKEDHHGTRHNKRPVESNSD